MKYNRLFFIKDNIRQFVTMYNLSYTNFFNLLDNNNQLLKDFEKFSKLDFKNSENKNPPNSIIELWKNNKTFKKKKMRVCILIHKNRYIGSFRYYKAKFTHIKSPKYNNNIYIKIGVVYIVPKYRRLGLASKMLSNIIKDNNKYLLNVDNINIKAYKLYKNLGFKIVESNKESTIMIRD